MSWTGIAPEPPEFSPGIAGVSPGSFAQWWHRRIDPGSRPQPCPAGVWDALLRGNAHSDADRTVAEDLLTASPYGMGDWAEQLLTFRQAVSARFTAEGCRQWIDLGTGLPHSASLFYDLRTRTRTRTADPHRLVCVDNDPFVIDCVRTYTRPREGHLRISAMRADLTQPRSLPRGLRRCRAWDPAQPVTVVAGAVLHHLAEPQAVNMLTALGQLLAPGSRLIVTHLAHVGSAPGEGIDGIAAAVHRYQASTAPLYLRTGQQVTDLLGPAWTLSPPGLTALRGYRPHLTTGWGMTATLTPPGAGR